MSTTYTPEEIERLAHKRVKAKIGWFIHATIFVLVNLVVFAKSQYAFGTHTWSPAPLLGWGLGLALHGISVWFVGTGSSLRERMVQRERDRLQSQQDRW